MPANGLALTLFIWMIVKQFFIPLPWEMLQRYFILMMDSPILLNLRLSTPYHRKWQKQLVLQQNPQLLQKHLLRICPAVSLFGSNSSSLFCRKLCQKQLREAYTMPQLLLDGVLLKKEQPPGLAKLQTQRNEDCTWFHLCSLFAWHFWCLVLACEFYT